MLSGVWTNVKREITYFSSTILISKTTDVMHVRVIIAIIYTVKS